MTTKREMLEEKRKEELLEMVEEKNLSVEEDVEKSDLIDLLEENYSKKDIEDWPNLGIDTIESNQITVDREDEEIEMVREDSIGKEPIEGSDKEDKRISTEKVDVEERDLIQRDPVFILAVFGAATAIVIAILLLFFGY